MLIVEYSACFSVFTVSRFISVLSCLAFQLNLVSQKAVKFQGNPDFQGNSYCITFQLLRGKLIIIDSSNVYLKNELSFNAEFILNQDIMLQLYQHFFAHCHQISKAQFYSREHQRKFLMTQKINQYLDTSLSVKHKQKNLSNCL